MKAHPPVLFRFYVPLTLTEIVGRRAHSLADLRQGILRVPEASIYHHTHRFLQQHLRQSPEPPNDFAHWTARALGRADVEEALASIEIIRCRTIAEIRERLASALTSFMEPGNGRRPVCPAGLEFHFLSARTFLFPTSFEAADLPGLRAALASAPAASLAFHMFGPRLGLGDEGMGYAPWFRSLGRDALAEAVDRLDPYTMTLEGLRLKLLEIVKDHEQA
jgi:hypothetical protein